MGALIAGLIVFLGVHSINIAAPGIRASQVAHNGARRWKLGFSLASLAGLALVVWGYGLARQASPTLWSPSLPTMHAAEGLAIIAFILVVAGYIPRTHFKQTLGHPMTAGVALWAFAHLLANGRAADVLLFGAFLVWALVTFAVHRIRDAAARVTYPRGDLRHDVIAVVAGTVFAILFALFLHGPLIGVRPFG